MSAFRPFLARAMDGATLSAEGMRAAMAVILEGAASDIEIAGFLAALRARGETTEEIAAAASAMRDRALLVDAPAGAIDTAGTGGDGADTYNISTAAALVIAGCGAPVAKHGNRAASSRSGSSDILAELGVKLEIPPARITRCIEEAGVGFMFAAIHHRAVGAAAPARKGLGVRTLFNLLGPLSNPARAPYQLLGVFSAHLLRPMAEAAAQLGVEAAWVVHGSDGLDELTITGPSRVAALENGTVREFEIKPEDAELRRAPIDALRGGAPAENAAALRALLDGAAGPYRDVVVLNAAAALVLSGRAVDLNEAARRAEAAIDDGRAAARLDDLVRISNEPSETP